MALVQDLGKCSTSRGTSCVILCLEYYLNVRRAGSKTKYIMIHRVKVTHHFYINNWGVCFDDCVFCIFGNGWFNCRDAFHVVLCS